MTKILVTGGLGFIGSHLVDSLARDGNNKITVMDNLCSDSSSASYMRDDVEYWIDDIRNVQEGSYKGREFDLIYHLAALARIQPSFTTPLDYLSTDIMGTSHILEFARDCGARVVYAGSSSAFAGPMLNPYAFAKYTGEQTCEMYNRVFGTSTVIARFFNVYGTRHPTTGEYATIVGIFEEQTLAGLPLTITSDGEQRRDFTHISDIVSGLKALGDKTWAGEVFQLGTGRNYSINELADMFGGDKTYIPKRPGEAQITLSDSTKMKEATGWKPVIKLEDYVKNWRTEKTSNNNKKLLREKCIMCNSNDFKKIYSLNNFPVYMGTTTQAKKDDLYEDLEFLSCKKCGAGQIKNLIPLDILYKDSHSGAIGSIWREHHSQFSVFASKFVSGNLIEIGGSNLIVANNLANLDSVEAITVCDNQIYHHNIKSKKIIPKEEFFNPDMISDNIDCIIHTHLLEHLYDPVAEINDISRKLKPGAHMIFSAPLIDAMLKKFYTNAMNFEHTYLLCEEKIKEILRSSGFKILESKPFNEFCTFYACQKVEKNTEINSGNYPDELIISEFVKHHIEEVGTIIDKIGNEKDNVFIFGAHIFTQYLLKCGLDESLFDCVLDNDKNKIGGRLYGTGLEVSSPSILKDLKSPLIILKAAQYTEEIKSDILDNINPSARFIL